MQNLMRDFIRESAKLEVEKVVSLGLPANVGRVFGGNVVPDARYDKFRNPESERSLGKTPEIFCLISYGDGQTIIASAVKNYWIQIADIIISIRKSPLSATTKNILEKEIKNNFLDEFKPKDDFFTQNAS